MPGAAFLLQEPILKAEREHGVYDFLVLIAGEAPVKLRVAAVAPVWRVLVHEADEIVPFWECVRHPLKQPDGVIPVAWQDQVADYDAAVHKLALELGFPCLRHHLPDRGRGGLEIIRRP